jgi:serine protease Do
MKGSMTKMKNRRIIIGIVSLLAVIALAGCSGIATGVFQSSQTQAQATTENVAAISQAVQSPVASTTAPQGVNETTQDAITTVVEEVTPAVVFIDTTFQPQQQNDSFSFPGSRYAPQQQQPQEGQGSGVIVDGQNGYILTNNHVVKNAMEIKVTLPDGRTFTGTTVGTDPLADIAVVKIDATNLPQAKLANNSNLKVGSWAIAIGNPYGFEDSVTVGVVSALDRTISDPDTGNPLMDLIQTDAAINPGNSGGALVNIKGEVIGINTALMTSAQGIGFAVNIDAASRSMLQIIQTGKVTRPWMGITYTLVTQAIADQMKLPQASGILVGTVTSGGPAEKAGIKANDVIQTMNGTTISKADSLRQLILSMKVGDPLHLTVWRNGQTLTLNLTLVEMPNQN